MISLAKDTPEARSWIYDILLQGGIRLPTVEGFSVRENRVTALFERLKSTIDVKKWSEREISSWLEEGDLQDSYSRLRLAGDLNVPLYIVLWHDNVESFRVLSISKGIRGEKLAVRDEEFFVSCKDFAGWISGLKGIHVSKGFVEPGRLSFVDECLRKFGVPWPGNLDGFLMSPRTGGVDVIFELTRTRKRSVEEHNLNDFFRKDFNRWKPLDILRIQLNVPMFIITWSSDETMVKIQKLGNVGQTQLEFEKTEFSQRNQVVDWFKRLVRTLG